MGMPPRLPHEHRFVAPHRYEFTSFDRREVDGIRSIVGELADLEAVEAAVEGQDAVVHLAADTAVEATWESTLSNNFVSTYNVFEASKRAGVRGVVFASSQHATGGYYHEPWNISVMETSTCWRPVSIRWWTRPVRSARMATTELPRRTARPWAATITITTS